jgi:hypothetical protein
MVDAATADDPMQVAYRKYDALTHRIGRFGPSIRALLSLAGEQERIVSLPKPSGIVARTLPKAIRYRICNCVTRMRVDEIPS